MRCLFLHAFDVHDTLNLTYIVMLHAMNFYLDTVEMNPIMNE